jgi:hypothetical protein
MFISPASDGEFRKPLNVCQRAKHDRRDMHIV